ncbi:Threonine dehydratase [Monocercomonoides exilis]|uniref:Threonine dehydratase n=1 Tax=Monocercomonoides exilis TaxID=2049356 RepID=UPI0035595DA6|nr:Threonine dehydratase [Monocercomonoides exilis]|eukprot:MONOS_5236.1-p1 / transcript=MONOS_5236.1 / gene=MONOS_5236 / organism=Monocercomonoides_exilis_PA203 / gene_product=Threonine dehydratase / transcript_product=Threonine dehydratase / location=Mono_scaffold00150:12895-14115(+) / protein_length=407 / sequence_SO=supercontig / SO=protein_coding / is_pseudo=false
MATEQRQITINDIKRAAQTLAPILERTPVIKSHLLSTETQEVFLKMENLQRTGSFKVRGAFNKIASLSEEEKKKGIIASSAGNHAQGVALGGQHFGIPAVIVMPDGTPKAKVENTRSYGAEIVFGGPIYDDAYATARRLQKEKGYTFIHPFDDDVVIAGQGTVALEIMEQLKEVDAIVVPIGGGGLVCGTAIAARHFNPKIRIIGVQASHAASMRDSLAHGSVIELDKAKTIADGIQVRRPGDRTFELCRELGVEVVTVEEEEIQEAILFLLEKHHIISEGAGAVPVAAFMSKKIDPSIGKVCLLVSGGNIDAHVVAEIIDRGLLLQKRRFRFTTMIDDKPNALGRLTSLIGELKINIMQITQTRQKYGLDLAFQVVDVLVETGGKEQTNHLVETLKEHGYSVEEL